MDVLIGASHPSWHPEMAERARAGGDLWVYRGIFGKCIGGRHSLIREETRRCDSLFTVNHTYHANLRPLDSISSHELEFCPNRVAQYKDPQIVTNIPQIVDIPEEQLNTEHTGSWNISELVELSEEPLCAEHLDSSHSSANTLNHLQTWDIPDSHQLSEADSGETPSGVNHRSLVRGCFGTKAEVMKEDEMFF